MHLNRPCGVCGLRCMAQSPPVLELAGLILPVAADEPWHAADLGGVSAHLLHQLLSHLSAYSGPLRWHYKSSAPVMSLPNIRSQWWPDIVRASEGLDRSPYVHSCASNAPGLIDLCGGPERATLWP